VQELQARLNALGNHLDVDGQFGAATENAVKVQQDRGGLAVDGKVGKKTWKALWHDLAFDRLLERGSGGADVQEIQARLNVLGNHLAVDGQFGAATENAVKVMQAQLDLTVDGKVGPQTWTALWSTPPR
jgi:peptidoglycan DL-endopeptidase CwlO